VRERASFIIISPRQPDLALRAEQFRIHFSRFMEAAVGKGAAQKLSFFLYFELYTWPLGARMLVSKLHQRAPGKHGNCLRRPRGPNINASKAENTLFALQTNAGTDIKIIPRSGRKNKKRRTTGNIFLYGHSSPGVRERKRAALEQSCERRTAAEF
jgi:hypothetical protein